MGTLEISSQSSFDFRCSLVSVHPVKYSAGFLKASLVCLHVHPLVGHRDMALL